MKVLLLTSAIALGLTGTAIAQEAAPAAPASPAAQAPAAPAAVTDQEVQKVAALAADVKKLNESLQPKIAAAADADAKAAVQKELDAGIQASLSKHGLTADRYNEIARAAQADRSLAERITKATSGGDSSTAAATGGQAPTSANEPGRE